VHATIVTPASMVDKGWVDEHILSSMRFRTTVELAGKTATGLQVPDDVVSVLGGGKRAAVQVTVGSHIYRTTIASMGGRYMVPLSAQNRAAAGVAAGDEIDVDVALDTAPREITVPADLADALAQHDGAREFFEALAYTHRKEWVRWIEEAKKQEIRSSRIAKAVESLGTGKRTH
jgi:Bacteriocin-protection, YdeI or OmpD-Associated/Domain of unknown function (DUF1905)